MMPGLDVSTPGRFEYCGCAVANPEVRIQKQNTRSDLFMVVASIRPQHSPQAPHADIGFWPRRKSALDGSYKDRRNTSEEEKAEGTAIGLHRRLYSPSYGLTVHESPRVQELSVGMQVVPPSPCATCMHTLPIGQL